MKPGRNDPCPCGSGTKYKNCCARKDAAAASPLHLVGRDSDGDLRSVVMDTLRRPIPWEADVTPVPARLESEPAARPAAVLIAGGGLVLSVDLAMHPPSDAVGVATLLRDAIATLLANGGAIPPLVTVRHVEVADQLRPLLRQLDIETVIDSRALTTIDDAAVGLRRQLSGRDVDMPAVSNPDVWAAWDLPASVVHDLFVAAAEFYGASPWRLLANDDLLELRMPDGAKWFGCILGAGGDQFGLALYESSDDFSAFLHGRDPAAGFAAIRHVLLSLTFDARGDIPKPMRREITHAGWPVHGPSAYPNLWVLNTIGGGLSVGQARDMTTALGVVARFASVRGASRADGSSPVPVPWTDASGCSVRPA